MRAMNNINKKYPKLMEWYDPYTGSFFVSIEVVKHDNPMGEFNRLKEEYKEEMLEFLKEFGLRMIDGKFDTNNEDQQYFYCEDLGEEDDDFYLFGLCCMLDGFECDYESYHKEVLDYKMNRMYLGLKNK